MLADRENARRSGRKVPESGDEAVRRSSHFRLSFVGTGFSRVRNIIGSRVTLAVVELGNGVASDIS
jgi:hypothetical protein